LACRGRMDGVADDVSLVIVVVRPHTSTTMNAVRNAASFSSQPNAPAQPRRAHIPVETTRHLTPAGGGSGLLAGPKPRNERRDLGDVRIIRSAKTGSQQAFLTVNPEPGAYPVDEDRNERRRPS